MLLGPRRRLGPQGQGDEMNNSYRSLLLLSTVAAVALGAEPSFGQQSGAASNPDSTMLETVTITGTRVVRDGYQAPTPTTVFGAADIEAKAPANIADAVNSLPSLAGSATPSTSGAAISSGYSGINTLNLRNLGPNRTLVLVDGQRVGAANLVGWVDINNIPEALIKRIDIVTGGASADWGSDAVAGVVNFVLDKNFTGLKGEVSGGETTYGDGANYKVAVTWGSGFGNGRGHVLLSLEDAHDDGIKGYPRAWAYNANMLSNNPNYVPGNGQPQLLTGFTSIATATPGGIITSGPAKGVYFGAGGIPLQFNYGIVSGNFMIGGQTDSYKYAVETGDLAPVMDRKNIFFRSSFDVTEHLNVFGQVFFGSTITNQNGLAPPTVNNFFTVKPSNAFLPASVAATAGTTPFTMGSFLQDTGPVSEATSRNALRAVVGANGDFDAIGTNWAWDAYAQTTISSSDVRARELELANLRAAIDAVRNPTTGAIQCASIATNPTCVPYDLFGIGVNSQAAIDYVIGTAWGHTKLTQDVVAANLRGEPISDWAGPISIAMGIEHRSEAVTGANDPISASNGWRSGNQHASHGFYDVTEGYFEAVVPLAKDAPFAKTLDLNVGIRETGYSLAGVVTTWKAGVTYSPIDDITFRANRSRDIRAPNLSELFAAGITVVNTGIIDSVTHTVTGSVLTVTTGTTNLKPEVADSIGLGVVVSPTFIPGFQFSVDYYSIDISNGIYTMSPQQLIDECAQGLAQACATLTRDSSGVIVQENVVPVNLARQIARGLDFEASYRHDVSLGSILDGVFTARAVATNYLKNTFDNRVTAPTDNVGTNNDQGPGESFFSLPHWKLQADLGWEQGPLALGFTARAISAGVTNTTYIQCSTACPLSTAAHPTINDNHISGTIYFDANVGYDLPYGLHGFLVVHNIFNTAPVQTPFGPGLGTPPTASSASLYDVLGRTFRVGVRFKM